MISAAFPYKKQRRKVLGREMAYVEIGKGDPIVFLHGNPTSSYLWRNVLPHLEPLGRCIAPDLIGMGDSDKLPDSGPSSYRFVEHRRYLGALLEALNVHERVTLVLHDWGSTLGFDWANHHRDAVRGIAYMEAMVGRQYWDHWDKFGMRPVLEALRSEAGEQMVLQDNFFIEKVLPGAILRKLSDAEMAEYRRPFTEPGEGRRPTLTFPREIPIEGDPVDVTQAVDAYADWLKSSSVPKLFVKAEPGGILAEGKVLEQARSFPAQTEVTVRGVHFVQEDSPDEIGRAVAGWMKTLGCPEAVRRPQFQEDENGSERCERGPRPRWLGGRIELGACRYGAGGPRHSGSRGAAAVDRTGRRCSGAQPQHRAHARVGRVGGTRLRWRGHRAGASRACESVGLRNRVRA
jgi:haloalkane dehalogenase